MTGTVSATRTSGLATFVRFGITGGIGLAVDVGLFNLLRATVWSPTHVTHGALVAKAVSTLCAIGVNWIGNRYWAFRDRRRPQVAREGVMFLAASGLGMLVSLLCLWCSHDLLGLTTAVDDNVSANVVGLALGTVVRFWLYRSWVYRDRTA